MIKKIAYLISDYVVFTKKKPTGCVCGSLSIFFLALWIVITIMFLNPLAIEERKWVTSPCRIASIVAEPQPHCDIAHNELECTNITTQQLPNCLDLQQNYTAGVCWGYPCCFSQNCTKTCYKCTPGHNNIENCTPYPCDCTCIDEIPMNIDQVNCRNSYTLVIGMEVWNPDVWMLVRFNATISSNLPWYWRPDPYNIKEVMGMLPDGYEVDKRVDCFYNVDTPYDVSTNEHHPSDAFVMTIIFGVVCPICLFLLTLAFFIGFVKKEILPQ